MWLLTDRNSLWHRQTWNIPGSRSNKELADLIKRGQTKREIAIIGLSLATLTRYDNVVFLKSYFPNNPDLQKVAKLLYNLSKLYEKAANLLKRNYTEETRETITKILQEAAKYEKQVGYLMLHAAEKSP